MWSLGKYKGIGCFTLRLHFYTKLLSDICQHLLLLPPLSWSNFTTSVICKMFRIRLLTSTAPQLQMSFQAPAIIIITWYKIIVTNTPRLKTEGIFITVCILNFIYGIYTIKHWKSSLKNNLNMESHMAILFTLCISAPYLFVSIIISTIIFIITIPDVISENLSDPWDTVGLPLSPPHLLPSCCHSSFYIGLPL